MNKDLRRRVAIIDGGEDHPTFRETLVFQCRPKNDDGTMFYPNSQGSGKRDVPHQSRERSLALPGEARRGRRGTPPRVPH